MKKFAVLAASFFLFLSLVATNVAADNPDVDITIKGGLGWYIEVYNNGTEDVLLNYTVVVHRILSGRIIRNVTGNTTCPPGLSIYVRVISFFTLCPIARITIAAESCEESLTREGIVLFSMFVIFQE